MELQRLFHVVMDTEGNLGLEILDDNLSEMEVLGMLAWAQSEILDGMKEDDDKGGGGPRAFTVVLN